MILRIIFSTALIIILAGCSQGGWMGYYEMKSPAVYNTKIVYGYAKHGETNVSNIASVKIKGNDSIGLGLPRDCSGFMIAGFFTPLTPPIPIPWHRSWSTAGKNGEGLCHYFMAETKPKAKLQLKTNNQIYEPRELDGEYGYTKYIFPVRVKDIDSGSIIIEKDGEKLEVPFEYDYIKFWF